MTSQEICMLALVGFFMLAFLFLALMVLEVFYLIIEKKQRQVLSKTKQRVVGMVLRVEKKKMSAPINPLMFMNPAVMAGAAVLKSALQEEYQLLYLKVNHEETTLRCSGCFKPGDKLTLDRVQEEVALRYPLSLYLLGLAPFWKMQDTEVYYQRA